MLQFGEYLHNLESRCSMCLSLSISKILPFLAKFFIFLNFVEQLVLFIPVHGTDVFCDFFAIRFLGVSQQLLVSNIRERVNQVQYWSLRVLLGAVMREVPWLFAVETESLPKEFSLFFVCHGIDGSFNYIDVHRIWVSVRSGFRLVPRPFIPPLDWLSEVPVPVKIVIVATVFSLGGLGILVDLVVLNGFGEPSILVNSTQGCLQVFEWVDFVRVSHDLYSEGGVQNSSEHSYGEGIVLYFGARFEDPKFIDNFFCHSFVLSHGFEFAKRFFNLVFFGKILMEVVSKFGDSGPGYFVVIILGKVGDVKLLPRVCFSSVDIGEDELGLRDFGSEIFDVWGERCDVSLIEENTNTKHTHKWSEAQWPSDTIHTN